MPRAPGQGRRPLRPGDGAADRQSRPAVEGPDRRPQAHLRGRRRGPRRHDPRASRLRPEARLPILRHGGARTSRPTCSCAGPAPAMRSSSTRRPCRGCWSTAATIRSSSPGPQDKASRAWLSECLQSANWLVKALDQRARTIVKVVSRDRQAAAGLLRARRVGDEADDPARGRRGDRDARIDGQPGHLEQISAVRPRAVRAQIFLRLGRRLGRGRRRGGRGGQGRRSRS